MTTTAKGTARKRAVARSKKVERNEQRVEEVKRDEETGRKPTARKNGAKAPAKKAPTKKVPEKPKAVDSGGPAWQADASLGSNVDRLKTAGVTWKGIAEMANANGVEMPWPDGGKLLRARKQHLAGTEGKEKPRRVSTGGRTSRTATPEDRALTVGERLAHAISTRDVPWDGETPDDDILELLNGKKISYVSKLTGLESTTRILRDTKHLKMGHGADGPYVSFVSQEGPFMTVSLSRILSVK